MWVLKKSYILLTLGEEKLMTQSYHPSGSSTAHRRRTDLMPTITLSSASPAAPSSGLSRSSTPGNKMPRSPGKAVSMSRLDMLSKPRLRLHATPSNSAPKTRQTPKTASPPNQKKKMSQSMSHLAILSASGSSPNGKRMVLKTSTKGRSMLVTNDHQSNWMKGRKSGKTVVEALTHALHEIHFTDFFLHESSVFNLHYIL
jgi:hypothetical protein